MRNGTMVENGTLTAYRVFLRGLSVALFLGILGCGKGEECEKARLEASRAWQTVTQQAGEAELKGPPGFDELSAPQKAEHTKLWRDLKTQTELVSSSFTYER